MAEPTTVARPYAEAAFEIAREQNALPVWSRSHDDLHWTAHALSCPHFPSYVVPVHTDGHRTTAWSLARYRVGSPGVFQRLSGDLPTKRKSSGSNLGPAGTWR